MMLEWKEAYSTGEEEIDNQHKTLFEFVNTLEKHIQENHGEEYLEQSIDFLENYARIHFRYEEICMFQYKCPIAQTNKLAHQKYMDNLHSYQERFKKDGIRADLCQEIQKTTEEWLVSHICRIDTQLKECLPHT